MRNYFWIVWFLFATFAARIGAQDFGYTIGGSGGIDANSSSLAPFSFSGSRYQQVYSSVYFPGSNLGISGLWISNIAFRVDATNGMGWVGTYTNIQIDLSTTLRQPNDLSSVFSENIGLDDTVVFGPDTLSVVVGFPGDPGRFDLRFNLSQGFFYQPDEGNLLLDIRVLGNGIFPSTLDASRGLTLSSSVFSSSGGTVGIPDNLALVTRLQGLLVAVPEPSTPALFLLGAACWLLSRRKAKR